MNKIILMGRLTRDPDIRYSQGQNATAVASFSLAVDRKFKRDGEPDADFFNCSAFGRTAEFCEKFVTKGTKVMLEGRLQNDNYTDRNGNKVYSVKVYVDAIEFAESKKANEEQASNPAPDSGRDGFMQIPDIDMDDLPFA